MKSKMQGLRASWFSSLLHKKILAGLLALVMTLTLPSAALAQAYRYWWQVVDEAGRPYLGQSTKCSVYSIGTGTALAYHFSSNLANVGSTMPLTSDANSQLHFWSSANTDVGVVCNTASGGFASTRLRYTDHTIMIDRQGRKVVSFGFTGSTTSVNTNVFVPAGAVVRDVLIQLTAGQANNHLDVGIRGSHFGAHSASALVHRLSLQTGDLWIRAHATLGSSGGIWPYISQVHRGAALAVYHAVTTAQAIRATDAQYFPGFYLEVPYVVGGRNPNDAGGSGLGIELNYRTALATAGVSGHVYVLYDYFHMSAGSDYRF